VVPLEPFLMENIFCKDKAPPELIKACIDFRDELFKYFASNLML
jgi:hypothetical protein